MKTLILILMMQLMVLAILPYLVQRSVDQAFIANVE